MSRRVARVLMMLITGAVFAGVAFAFVGLVRALVWCVGGSLDGMDGMARPFVVVFALVLGLAVAGFFSDQVSR